MPRRDTGFSRETKNLIRSRAEDRCERCGEHHSDATAHHRRPRGAGGTRRADTNTAANGLWVCLMCHLFIESYRDMAFANGWLVRQSHDPLATPVLLRGQWHLLDTLGYSYRIPEPAGGVAS